MSFQILTKEWVLWKFFHFKFDEVSPVLNFLHFFSLEIEKTKEDTSQGSNFIDSSVLLLLPL